MNMCACIDDEMASYGLFTAVIKRAHQLLKMSDVIFPLLSILICISALAGVVEPRKCYQCRYNDWEIDRFDICLDPFLPEPGEVTGVSCNGMCTKSVYTRNGEITAMNRSCIPYTETAEKCIHGCFELVRGGDQRTCVWCCDNNNFCNCADTVTHGHQLGACLLAFLVTWLT
ncbi:uncharacterized protein LOC110982398 [Acanthaster planci]|uniref:Uncharacterized protein LOC110982398 n=1 Tax=Acanthaster planci TaxID=133434 RepID=A0A8B7YVF2_ACAPL|nr:uncharacterized protein LOC110982398 [Acanthaster planci]